MEDPPDKYRNLTIGSIEPSRDRDDEDRTIRRPGMMFTVYPAEGGTVIQCRANGHGELTTTKNASSQPRLYVIHDDDKFNEELANIIHMERIRML